MSKFIVFSCGDLIGNVENGKVTNFNLESKFLKAYKEDFEKDMPASSKD